MSGPDESDMLAGVCGWPKVCQVVEAYLGKGPCIRILPFYQIHCNKLTRPRGNTAHPSAQGPN